MRRPKKDKEAAEVTATADPQDGQLADCPDTIDIPAGDPAATIDEEVAEAIVDEIIEEAADEAEDPIAVAAAMHMHPGTPGHEMFLDHIQSISAYGGAGRRSDEEKVKWLDEVIVQCVARQYDFIPDNSRLFMTKALFNQAASINPMINSEIVAFADKQIGRVAVTLIADEIGFVRQYCERPDCKGHLVDANYLEEFREVVARRAEDRCPICGENHEESRHGPSPLPDNPTLGDIMKLILGRGRA